MLSQVTLQSFSWVLELFSEWLLQFHLSQITKYVYIVIFMILHTVYVCANS